VKANHTRRLFLCLLVLIAGGLASGVHAQKPTSEFTTTDPKKVKILEDSALEKDPEIDHFRHLCPGLGGYAVVHEGGDLRSWINLRFQDQVTDLMNDTLTACPGNFPAKANNVVEWRGVRQGGVFVPYAIIYRMRSSDEEGKKTFETLVVIKLDKGKSKVVGHVSGKEGNDKAEAMADRLCAPGR
jgi:hypothetical protein